MGRDKALVEVDGVPMAVRVARLLEAAGATRVVAVGGDAEALRGVGLEYVADPRQGDGPLAGIAAALAAAKNESAVAVLACDLIDATAVGVRSVVTALEDADGAEVAVPAVHGQLEPMHAVWRPGALATIEAALNAGERAVHAVFDRLVTVRVPDLDPACFRNVNSPADLGHT